MREPKREREREREKEREKERESERGNRKVQPVCWMNVELAAVMCTVFKHTHEVFCNMRDE